MITICVDIHSRLHTIAGAISPISNTNRALQHFAIFQIRLVVYPICFFGIKRYGIVGSIGGANGLHNIKTVGLASLYIDSKCIRVVVVGSIGLVLVPGPFTIRVSLIGSIGIIYKKNFKSSIIFTNLTNELNIVISPWEGKWIGSGHSIHRTGSYNGNGVNSPCPVIAESILCGQIMGTGCGVNGNNNSGSSGHPAVNLYC